MIITRQKYLDMLVAGQGNGLVKIVTGGRRCGKSFLLFQIFHQYLLQHGVDEGHLIEVSLDDRRNRKLCDPDALLDYLDSRIKSDGKTNFIFLDEIQLVDDFIGRAWVVTGIKKNGSEAMRRTLMLYVNESGFYALVLGSKLSTAVKFKNRASDATLQALNQRFIPNFEPPKNSNFIRLTTHNAPAQQINERQLAALPSRAFSYTAEVEDNFPESSYPADFMLTLKPGAQVMFIKNDPQHRFYNGMIGEVIGVKPDEEGDKIIVRSKDSDEEFELEKMEWVIENLSKNAVDAMGANGGQITLHVEEIDDKAIIEVSDTGNGIRKKDLKNVFRPGFTTKKRGWGLGLSLAKRIVEEYHHGKIWVKSTEIGHQGYSGGCHWRNLDWR